MPNINLTDINYSVLDLAVITEGQQPADAIHNSRDLARHVEEWGYGRFWMAEHHNMDNIASSATAVLLGYIAEATDSIRVGSGGIMLPNHSPLIIAEQFGTLASLYPDRVDLGLGRAPGTDPDTARAIRADREEAIRRFPDNIKKLQQYFSNRLSSDQVRAIPGQGTEVPIWILGSSPDSAYLAGEMGLPYAFAAHFAPQQLMQALKVYHEHFKPSAQLDEPYSMACVNVVAAEDDDKAEWLSTSLKQMFKGVITGKRTPMPPPIPVEEMDQIWTSYQKMIAQQMLSCSFIGGQEKVEEQVRDFIADTQVDELMIASYIYDHQERLASHRLFAEIMKGQTSPTAETS